MGYWKNKFINVYELLGYYGQAQYKRKINEKINNSVNRAQFELYALNNAWRHMLNVKYHIKYPSTSLSAAEGLWKQKYLCN